MNIRIPKSGFIANTLWLLLGNLGAQVINLLTLPIITRIYSPESYGVFTLFLSISVLFNCISCLNFEKAILLPKQEKDGFNMFFLCIIFVSFFTSISLIAAFIINCLELGLPKSYLSVIPYLYLLPIYIFIHGSSRALYFLLIRQNIFTIQPITRICEVSANKIISIVYFYLFSNSPMGLIFSAIAGAAIALVLLLKENLGKLKRYLFSINCNSIIDNFKRYKSFAVYSLSSLLEMFSREIIPVMCAFMFSPLIVGVIGLGSRVIQQPLGMLGDAISKSFLQKVSEAHRNGQRYDIYVYSLFDSLIQISLVPLLLFSVIAPDVFEVVFGEEWRMSGVFFRALGASYLASFIYRPMSIVIDVQEKQQMRFGFNILRSAICIVSLLYGAYIYNNPLYALIFYSVANVLAVSVYIGLILIYSGIQMAGILRIFLREFLIGSILLILFSFLNVYFVLTPLALFSLVGFMGFGYCASILFRQPQLRRIINFHE